MSQDLKNENESLLEVARELKSSPGSPPEDLRLNMKLPTSFLQDRDFSDEAFDSLQAFYSFCNRSMSEANICLEKINDALRKHLLNAELSLEEEKLLFHGDSAESTASWLASSAATQNPSVDTQTQPETCLAAINEEIEVLEALRQQVFQQDQLIDQQRGEIDSLTSRVQSVLAALPQLMTNLNFCSMAGVKKNISLFDEKLFGLKREQEKLKESLELSTFLNSGLTGHPVSGLSGASTASKRTARPQQTPRSAAPRDYLKLMQSLMKRHTQQQ